MPRNYTRKSQRGATYTPEQLLAAVESVRNKRLSLRRASLVYKIPKTTILDHVTGRRGTKSKRFGRDLDIPYDEEQKIAEGIRVMEKGGFGLSRLEVIEKVGEYVKKNKLKTRFKDSIPGPDWFIGFRKRHRLSIKKPQAVEMARQKCLDPFIIYDYFELLKRTISELGLENKPDHIWNLDETSFCVDPKKTKMVGAIGTAATRTISTPGRENTTVLMSCSAAGSKGTPLIIFKGLHIYDEWTAPEEDPENPEVVYAATKKGWMESEVFKNYFSKILISDFKNKRPILLIYDGHATHVNISLIEEAVKEQVTILKLPPHSSHLLQPLDVSVFKPIKDRWDAKLVKWQREHPGKKILKKTFSVLTKTIWKETDPVVIQHGFRKAGIYPFNDQVITPEKFDPSAYKRWQSIRTGMVHITADKDPNNAMEVLTASPVGTSNNNSIPYRSDVIAEVTEISSSSLCQSTLTNGTPRDSPSTNIPFDQILASTLDPAKNDNIEKKPKKRVAGGAEVITRNEVILRLKEKETLLKGPKERKNTSNKNTKGRPRQNKILDSDEDDEETIEYEEEDLETMEDICEQMIEEEAQLEEEITGSLSKLSVSKWVLVKFPGKRNIKYYVGKVMAIKDQEIEIKFCRKSNFFFKEISI